MERAVYTNNQVRAWYDHANQEITQLTREKGDLKTKVDRLKQKQFSNLKYMSIATCATYLAVHLTYSSLLDDYPVAKSVINCLPVAILMSTGYMSVVSYDTNHNIDLEHTAMLTVEEKISETYHQTLHRETHRLRDDT